jgi:hypothetical protein
MWGEFSGSKLNSYKVVKHCPRRGVSNANLGTAPGARGVAIAASTSIAPSETATTSLAA